MDIRVSGHQIDTGEALRGQVDARLHGIADKYFSRAISAFILSTHRGRSSDSPASR